MKKVTVTIDQAKKKLAQLLEKALNNEEVTICRGSHPIARLASIAGANGKRRPGSLKGTLVVGPEFFEPIPADEW